MNKTSNFNDHYNYVYNNVYNALNDKMSDKAKYIKENIIDKCNYKYIIIYMHAVAFEPLQRPQHILRELAKNQNLCFFCDIPNNSSDIVKEYEKNMYIVYNQEELISSLRFCKNVVLYISYGLQYIYKEFLNSPFVWYDILDEPKFLSNYKFLKDIYKKLSKESNLITYSANNLYKYCKNCKNTLYLPNAVKIEDFEIVDNFEDESIKLLNNFKKNNFKIIGYFGAIEEWFDISIIYDILNKINNVKIVLIGNVNIKIKNNDNIILLGQKPYSFLKYYARYFDVSIIPFKKNKVTNSVSPVKFFEYCALNLPCVSTNIKEMNNYINNEGVAIAKNNKEFIKYIINFLNLGKCNNIKIANNNTWKSRVEIILNKFEEFYNDK